MRHSMSHGGANGVSMTGIARNNAAYQDRFLPHMNGLNTWLQLLQWQICTHVHKINTEIYQNLRSREVGIILTKQWRLFPTF